MCLSIYVRRTFGTSSAVFQTIARLAEGWTELVVRVVEQERSPQEDHRNGEEGGRHVVRLCLSFLEKLLLLRGGPSGQKSEAGESDRI